MLRLCICLSLWGWVQCSSSHPTQQPEELRDDVTAQEEKTALGGVLWVHIYKHHHIYKQLVFVVPCWKSRPYCRCLNICCLHHCSLSNPPGWYGGNRALQYLLQISQQRGERKCFGSNWILVMDSRIYWRNENVNSIHDPNEHTCSLFL